MEIPTETPFKIYYVCLVVAVLAGVIYHLFYHPEAHFVWDKIPAFHAILGFVGCFVLMAIAKTLGNYWLMKEEDYYD